MTERLPVVFCTYGGDQRAILTAAANPLVMPGEVVETPFGDFPVTLGMFGLTMRGPNMLREGMWPVEAVYDEGADSTRVGWSYLPPQEDD